MAPVPRLEPEAPGRQRPGDTSTAGGKGEKREGIGVKKRGERVRKEEKKGSGDEDCSPDLCHPIQNSVPETLKHKNQNIRRRQIYFHRSDLHRFISDSGATHLSCLVSQTIG